MMPQQPVETIDALVAGCTDELVVVDRGPVRLLIFNRPDKRNAMSSAMRRGYARELTRAETDDAVHCVIITGAHGYFSAGVDIKERPLAPNMPMVRPHPVEASRSITKPLIAMIDGPCITGGLELALSCTFIIGSDRSSYADTHLKIGILPGWGGISLLATAIGARRAAQMQLSGERIFAETALQWGLINQVVPSAEILSHCLSLATAMAAFDPVKRAALIRLNRRVDTLGRDEALAIEAMEIERIRAVAANEQCKDNT
jgi:enoyl-CoA hydratase